MLFVGGTMKYMRIFMGNFAYLMNTLEIYLVYSRAKFPMPESFKTLQRMNDGCFDWTQCGADEVDR